MLVPVKNLRRGDRVALEEGGVGTVAHCVRCSIVEGAPKLGGAFEIKWTDQDGKHGQAIVSGLDQVEVIDEEISRPPR